MQYVLWASKLIQFGGLALIGAAFAPFGRGRAGLLRHPWFLAYGTVIFILGCLVEWAHLAMTFGTWKLRFLLIPPREAGRVDARSAGGWGS
jgi:hypothetical protein